MMPPVKDGQPDTMAENKVGEPEVVYPVTTTESIGVTKDWTAELPPYSFTIYRFSK